jgi:hypothetical protein
MSDRHWYRAARHWCSTVFTESILYQSGGWLQWGDVPRVNGESRVGHVPMPDPVCTTQHTETPVSLFVCTPGKHSRQVGGGGGDTSPLPHDLKHQIWNKKFWEKIIAYFPLVRHGTHRSQIQVILSSRSQWPGCLRHELFSPAPTLTSWVRIPLRHGCLCVFCVRFFCFYSLKWDSQST